MSDHKEYRVTEVFATVSKTIMAKDALHAKLYRVDYGFRTIGYFPTIEQAENYVKLAGANNSLAPAGYQWTGDGVVVSS